MLSKLTGETQQLPLDLGHRTAQGREDFLITPSNQEAVSFIDLWPNWPTPMLIVRGPVASGKSHLIEVWKNQVGAASISPAQLLSDTAESIAEQGEHLAIDGLDPFLGDNQAETTLFHLYNMIKEDQRTMLIAMRMAPSQSEFALKDLQSRFRAAPVTTISPPDEELLSALLIKNFSDRQLPIKAEHINYLMPRMERSFSAVRKIVELADYKALSEKRPISIPLLRDVLFSLQEG